MIQDVTFGQERVDKDTTRFIAVGEKVQILLLMRLPGMRKRWSMMCWVLAQVNVY